MNILIVGYGVVGRATHAVLSRSPYFHQIHIYDPPQGYNYSPDDLDMAVVCTPCLDGEIDVVDELLNWAPEHIVIRSTVVPSAFDVLRERTGPGIIIHHWPEFLSEDTALMDAQSPDKFIWGTDNEQWYDSQLINKESANVFFRELFNKQPDVIAPLEVAATIKLTINTYYSAKVALNNIAYEAVKGNLEHYKEVMYALGMDQRITVSHREILHKGNRGAHGKCLPKDVRNFARYLEEIKAVSGSSNVLNTILEFHDELGKSSNLSDSGQT